MTTCSNCQTTQGPFNRRVVPGAALCGFDTKHEDYQKVVKACNARRAKLDKGNEQDEQRS